MPYTAVENALPKHQGIYEVKIRTTTGAEKLCRADWVPKNGFTPIAERLLPGERVTAWRIPK